MKTQTTLGLLVLIVAAATADSVSSSFGAGTEGWRAISVTQSGYSRAASYNLGYSATGGVSSGYVYLEDPDSDWWFFDAPSAYLGDQSMQYGGTLGFWLKSLIVATPDNAMPSVILRGGGKVLAYFKPDYPTSASWKYFEAPMAPTDRWKDVSTGGIPTPSAFLTALSGLTALEIRGEHYIGNDKEALDDVRLGSAATYPAQDAFDADPGDWIGVSFLLNDSSFNHLPMGPFSVSWQATGGRTGGCLKRTDYDENVSFWRLPDRYATRRGSLLNRSLSWWTYSDGTGTPIVPTYPDVVLLGATKTLVADVAGNPPLRVWTPTKVTFDASTPWRVNSRVGPLASQADIEQVLGELCAIYVNSEFIDGNDESRIDDVALSQGAPADLGVRVVLADWVGDVSGVSIDVRLSDGNGGVETHRVSLDAGGEATVSTYLRGNLEARVKASHWLAKIEPCTVADSGGSMSATLANGDVDGDNAVTVFDYNLLSDAFDSADGEPGWNADADLDGDGTVTVFDYNVLSNNFDLVGD